MVQFPILISTVLENVLLRVDAHNACQRSSSRPPDVTFSMPITGRAEQIMSYPDRLP